MQSLWLQALYLEAADLDFRGNAYLSPPLQPSPLLAPGELVLSASAALLKIHAKVKVK